MAPATRPALVSELLERRYALDPDVHLSDAERLSASLPDPPGREGGAALGRLLAGLALLGALAALVPPGPALLVVSALFAALGVAVTRTARRVAQDVPRGARVRGDLGPEHVVDLADPGHGWERRGRMVSALSTAATARQVAEVTGHRDVELLRRLDRDAWRVVRLSARASLLDPSAAGAVDGESVRLLSALRDEVGSLTSAWVLEDLPSLPGPSGRRELAARSA